MGVVPASDRNVVDNGHEAGRRRAHQAAICCLSLYHLPAQHQRHLHLQRNHPPSPLGTCLAGRLGRLANGGVFGLGGLGFGRGRGRVLAAAASTAAAVVLLPKALRPVMPSAGGGGGGSSDGSCPLRAAHCGAAPAAMPLPAHGECKARCGCANSTGAVQAFLEGARAQCRSRSCHTNWDVLKHLRAPQTLTQHQQGHEQPPEAGSSSHPSGLPHGLLSSHGLSAHVAASG